MQKTSVFSGLSKAILSTSVIGPVALPTPETSQDEDSSHDAGKKKTKTRPDSLDKEKRKDFFIHTPTEEMQRQREKYVTEVEELFGAALPGGDCWLHPWPPETEVGQPRGLIKCHFSWNDKDGHHKLDVNYGIVSLIINHHMTDAEIRGYIHHSWQLSHLCGNWTCCNYRHFTVESGPVNVSRNRCFSSDCECLHLPRCIKEKKRSLLLRQTTRRKIYKGINALTEADIAELSELGARLVRAVWKYHPDTTRKECRICHHTHILAPFCSVLRSRKKCEALLEALTRRKFPTLQMIQAKQLLTQICTDLS